MRRCWMVAALTIGMAGCGSSETQDQGEPTGTAENLAQVGAAGTQGERAVATIENARGETVGTATATRAEDGVRLALDVKGLPPGPHGTHVHTTGRCDPPAFGSAGGHWNPADSQHGLEDPTGQHAGDMPNLIVDAGGGGSLDYTLQGGRFQGLLEGDGSALVIHATADDQHTDPSGNSGDRIACGVFREP